MVSRLGQVLHEWLAYELAYERWLAAATRPRGVIEWGQEGLTGLLLLGPLGAVILARLVWGWSWTVPELVLWPTVLLQSLPGLWWNGRLERERDGRAMAGRLAAWEPPDARAC